VTAPGCEAEAENSESFGRSAFPNNRRFGPAKIHHLRLDRRQLKAR